MAVHQHDTTEVEPSEAEVREQLNRLLANPFFSNSKRFPMFLRFVVDHTLAGDAKNIKERTLGIEIFGGMRNTTPLPIQLSVSRPQRYASAWRSITRIPRI